MPILIGGGTVLVFGMISEDLKSQVEALSQDERRELSVLLTKLELERDSDYWEAVRRRSTDNAPENWVSAEQL